MRLFVHVVLSAWLCIATCAVIEWSKVLPPFPNISHSDAISLKQLWQMYLVKFNQLPSPLSYRHFASNVFKIWDHSKRSPSFSMGINQFSTLSPNQYKTYLGYRSDIKKLSGTIPRSAYLKLNQSAPLPKFVDWRREGCVTDVKDQGHCGSCWAFSAIGAIEGQYQRIKNSLVSFSEQQLVDCSSNFGNMGCDGGLMDNAFDYVREAGGVDREADYAYVSGSTGKSNDFCSFKLNVSLAKVTGLVDIQSGNDEELIEALVHKGPISIAIHAGLSSFMMYHSGIYDDPKCNGDQESLDHGVLLVGYGENKGVPYWLVKNSWGPHWGESGYIRIKRGGNLCGVATSASYPLL